MPMPTDFTGAAGDGANVGGYISTIRAPLTTNSYVARIDHDFNEKNRFFATYRYTTLTSLTTNQVDIGGLRRRRHPRDSRWRPRRACRSPRSGCSA